MQLLGTMLVVADIEKSKVFYEDVLGEAIKFDFGANKQFKSGLALQDKASMTKLFGIKQKQLEMGGHAMELYYETEEFDRFLLKLRDLPDIVYVNGQSKPAQYSWGQRAIRFYDPDMHMIEVGESMGDVVRRFFAQGLTAQDIADCTELPLSFIQECAN